jgi:hypothetical protein
MAGRANPPDPARAICRDPRSNVDQGATDGQSYRASRCLGRLPGRKPEATLDLALAL